MILHQLSNLQQRILVGGTGIIFLIIALFLSYTPGYAYLFITLITGTIALALWEYYRIAQAKGCLPLAKIGVCGSIAYVIATYFRSQSSQAQLMPEFVLGLTLICAFCYYFLKGSDPFVNLAVTLFGIFYLTIPLSYLIDINYFISPPTVNDGRWSLLYLFLVTKVTDMGAFFVGKHWGSRKLSPYISPKKTWEGAFGGLLSAILISFILYLLFRLGFNEHPLNLTFWQSLWLPAMISAIGQFGDLAESLLKRDVGVKDSSGYLPGLGGMLDVVDSLVFTAPFMYFFLNWQVVDI